MTFKKEHPDMAATTPGSKKQDKNLSENSLPQQLELFRTIPITYHLYNELERVAASRGGSAEKLAVEILEMYFASLRK